MKDKAQLETTRTQLVVSIGLTDGIIEHSQVLEAGRWPCHAQSNNKTYKLFFGQYASISWS